MKVTHELADGRKLENVSGYIVARSREMESLYRLEEARKEQAHESNN